MFNLYVNGNLYEANKSIEFLKNIGLQIKNRYKDFIVSIEDKQGCSIHYFF